MSRRISLLTQRTALFLSIPFDYPPFLLSSLHLFYASHLLCLSPSPTPPIDTLILLSPPSRGDISATTSPTPPHHLSPRNCGHNVSSRANDRGYNSAGGIGKEYRGPHLCEKKDFFSPQRLTVTQLPSWTLSPVRARNRWCETTSLLSTTTTIEIVLRYPWIRMRATNVCVRLERLKFVIGFELRRNSRRRETDIKIIFNGK